MINQFLIPMTFETTILYFYFFYFHKKVLKECFQIQARILKILPFNQILLLVEEVEVYLDNLKINLIKGCKLEVVEVEVEVEVYLVTKINKIHFYKTLNKILIKAVIIKKLIKTIRHINNNFLTIFKIKLIITNLIEIKFRIM